MKLTGALLAEFLREAGNTRKVLERVPQADWDWRPHEKSYPMGKLAAHIASLHGAWFHSTLRDDGFNLGGSWPAEANTVAGVLEIFDRNVGSKSPLNLPRGLNNLWSKGGIQYAPPIR